MSFAIIVCPDMVILGIVADGMLCNTASSSIVLCSGEIDRSVTVNDEEEGVSMRLDTLLSQPANRAKLNAAKLRNPSGWRAAAQQLPAASVASPAIDPYSTRHHLPAIAPSAPAGVSLAGCNTAVSGS